MKKNIKNTLKIQIEREIYKSEKGDYIVYLAIIKEDYKDLKLWEHQEISVKTNGVELTKGSKEITGILGIYQGKPTIEFYYEEFNPNTRYSQVNILTTIPGIGEFKANKILDKLPEGATIENFRDSNFKVEGITEEKAETIRESLNFFDNMIVLKELNCILGHEMSQKAIFNLSEQIETSNITIEEFKTKPYDILIKEMNYSFLKADKIALTLGVKYTDGIRLKYLMEYLVKKNLEQGSCYIELNDFIEILRNEKLFNKYSEQTILKMIDRNDRLYLDENRLYDILTYFNEIDSAAYIKRIATQNSFKYKENEIQDLINNFESIEGFKLHKTQKEAIKSVINNTFSVITGGAGTGKSTIVKCIVYCLKELRKRCILTAPTGKAARRLSECTNETTSTIHSFLLNEYKTGNVKIVDESSMIDLALFSDLADRVKFYDKVILVGDVNQLSSVGAGNVLKDIINSGCIKVIKLEKTFRQSKNSNITKFANDVIENKPFEIVKSKDFVVRECHSPNEYIQIGLHYYERLKNKYKSSLDKFYNETQMIIPFKGKEDSKVEIKVNYFNKLIKDKYNPKKNNDWFKFDVDDKVMNLENDTELDTYNGEVGRITEINKTDFKVYFHSLDREVSIIKNIENMKRFKLAYVSTVHKLQGSEYKYVIMIIPDKSFFLDSRLLYTGMTRAKEALVLLTNKENLYPVIKRTNSDKRKTYLKERIQKEFENIEKKEI